MKKTIAVTLLLSASLCAQSSPKLVVVNKGENTLAIVDVETGKVLGRATTGEGPHEVVTSADGKSAYVSNYGSREPGHTLSVVDLATYQASQVELGPLRRPHGLAEHDGQIYITAEMNKLIASYDPASDRVDWLMGTGQNATHMVIVSRDGSRMFTANIA